MTYNKQMIQSLIKTMVQGLKMIPEDCLMIANVFWKEAKEMGVSDDIAILHMSMELLGAKSMEEMRNRLQNILSKGETQ